MFRGFPGDGNLIARNHLDLHTHLAGAYDGCFGLLAGRVEQRQHTYKLPLALLIGPRHAEGTKAASREFIYGLLDRWLDLSGVG